MEKEHGKPDQEKTSEEMEWENLFQEKPDEEWEKQNQRRKRRKSLTFKIIGSLLAFSLVISSLQVWFDIYNIPALRFLEVSNRLSKLPKVREYKKSVVTIEGNGVKGTGFNIDEDGLIVTNEHVVDNTKKVNVQFKTGQIYSGKVISRNKELDLAIVDIEASNLSFLTLSFDQDLDEYVGEKIIFVGNPLAYTQIANEGNVEGKVFLPGWEVPVLMIDAPVYKGNSGSPVIDNDGKVIGVIFATFTLRENHKRMGAAIPSSLVKKVLTK